MDEDLLGPQLEEKLRKLQRLRDPQGEPEQSIARLLRCTVHTW